MVASLPCLAALLLPTLGDGACDITGRVALLHACRPVSWGLFDERCFLLVYRVLDVVREFFLDESVPDWAARGVADRGQRANVAHLEATTVALNARR